MEKLRSPAPRVGLAMGLILLVVGFTSANYGIVGLGVVLMLVGFFGRRAEN